MDENGRLNMSSTVTATATTTTTATPPVVKKRVRRAHSKSRNGCVNCKKLRVKCDEAHPACGNCVKRKKECEYVQQSQQSLATSNHHKRGSTASTTTDDDTDHNYVLASGSGSASPLEHAIGSFVLGDLSPCEREVLAHYKLAAGDFILSYGTLDAKIWHDYIPKLVLQVPHLAHSFFAITALHLGHVTPEREDMLTFAQSNFYKAMGEFETIVHSGQSVVQTEAAFLSTIFLMMISFCFQQQLPLIGQDHSQVDVLTITRGPIIVAKNLYPNLMQSNICSFLNQRSTSTTTQCDQYQYTAFDKLCEVADSLYEGGWLDSEQNVLFKTTLTNLKTCIKYSSLYNSPAGLVGWQMTLPHKFLFLARSNHFFAKIILIYHLASLLAIQDLFWIGQRPALEIPNLASQLDAKWDPLLLWPITLSNRSDLSIHNIWDLCCTDVDKISL
ncbi:hypothetical protein TRICI_000680 [Trichomonascus ciferrii]|uniref:Zn(2)-C6 fungal-type domain-containing protein n=1 Tax=Trichomonascus ciferrii TaxID=44093 RepID=A0A642VBT9_9ASCO|nr:hypothetical protein TRICI_000680 [Trichomonascus ciferrii]